MSVFMQKTVRILVCGLLLSAGIPMTAASAMDAMSNRYAAIRAPTEALIGRIERQRLQADLNALARERVRIQGLLRQTESLRFQDPISGFAAAERALDGRLDGLGIDFREARARLANDDRVRRGLSISGLPPHGGFDPGVAGLESEMTGIDEGTMTESVEDARAFVEGLLRANRARP